MAVCQSAQLTPEITICASEREALQANELCRQLTKSVLKRDFGLTISLPYDRLCPPVPVRYNYIRWIQDLLDTTSNSYTDKYDPTRKVIGLDVGTGASAIYALLACASRPAWLMYGTDIDSRSLFSAQKNVDSNKLVERIQLRLNTSDGPLLPLDALGAPRLDFCMCNPPFYSSAADMAASYENKSKPPSAVCTGAEVEMICEGGDVGFVLRMVMASRKLQQRVQWYSSMLGKLASVHQVIAKLKEIGVGNWAVTSLRAGRKTRRWAVAWSWGDYRPRNDVARSGELVQAILPFPTAQTIQIFDVNRQQTADIVNATLEALDLRWQWHADTWSGVGRAKENVWSRSARRKQKKVRDG